MFATNIGMSPKSKHAKASRVGSSGRRLSWLFVHHAFFLPAHCQTFENQVSEETNPPTL